MYCLHESWTEFIEKSKWQWFFVLAELLTVLHSAMDQRVRNNSMESEHLKSVMDSTRDEESTDTLSPEVIYLNHLNLWFTEFIGIPIYFHRISHKCTSIIVNILI